MGASKGTTDSQTTKHAGEGFHSVKSTEVNEGNDFSSIVEDAVTLERWDWLVQKISELGDFNGAYTGNALPDTVADSEFFNFLKALVFKFESSSEDTSIHIQYAEGKVLSKAEKLDVLASSFSPSVVSDAYDEFIEEKYASTFFTGVSAMGTTKWADILLLTWKTFQDEDIDDTVSVKKALMMMWYQVLDSEFDTYDLQRISAADFIEEFPVKNAVNLSLSGWDPSR